MLGNLFVNLFPCPLWSLVSQILPIAVVLSSRRLSQSRDDWRPVQAGLGLETCDLGVEMPSIGLSLTPNQQFQYTEGTADILRFCKLKAKFHYAILVADRSEAARRPVADLLTRASSLLAS